MSCWGDMMSWNDRNAKAKEVAHLREENERLKAECERLYDKIGPDCCGCSVDGPNDVCMVHAPMLRRAEAERDEAMEILSEGMGGGVADARSRQAAHDLVAARLRKKDRTMSEMMSFGDAKVWVDGLAADLIHQLKAERNAWKAEAKSLANYYGECVDTLEQNVAFRLKGGGND